MPYELFLAIRYLRTHRPRRLARVTAFAATLGIAFGVAALTIALSLSNGFRDEMRDKILRGTAHITLMRRDGQQIEDWHELVNRIRAVEGVADASPTTYDGALLSTTNGSSYAILRGLDREQPRAIAEVRRTITAGSIEPLLNEPSPFTNHQSPEKKRDDNSSPITSFDEIPSEAATPNAIIGAELAARTGLHVGDTATVISGEATLTPLGLAPRYRRVRVAGIFQSGLYEYDSTWTYLSLEDAARVVGTPPATTVVSIETRDIYASDDVARRVREALGAGWTTLDWRDANRPLFDALALERRTVALIIMLITIVAALNITTTLALVVVERRADIAVLVAMGARAGGVTLIFVIEGALVGALGALAGVSAGLAACVAADRFRLVRLPPDVYSLSSVPLHPHGSDVLLIALAAFAVSLLATVYPARQASRVRPAEVLRYE